jgi:hypothetical protein
MMTLPPDDEADIDELVNSILKNCSDYEPMISICSLARSLSIAMLSADVTPDRFFEAMESLNTDYQENYRRFKEEDGNTQLSR